MKLGGTLTSVIINVIFMRNVSTMHICRGWRRRFNWIRLVVKFGCVEVQCSAVTTSHEIEVAGGDKIEGSDNWMNAITNRWGWMWGVHRGVRRGFRGRGVNLRNMIYLCRNIHCFISKRRGWWIWFGGCLCRRAFRFYRQWMISHPSFVRQRGRISTICKH